MTVYCVSYDLNKVGQDYKALYEALRASPGFWHYLDSTWLISTNESAEELTKRLLASLDKNDRLLVIQVVANYQGWLPEKAWQWIREHVTKQAE